MERCARGKKSADQILPGCSSSWWGALGGALCIRFPFLFAASIPGRMELSLQTSVCLVLRIPHSEESSPRKERLPSHFHRTLPQGHTGVPASWLPRPPWEVYLGCVRRGFEEPELSYRCHPLTFKLHFHSGCMEPSQLTPMPCLPPASEAGRRVTLCLWWLHAMLGAQGLAEQGFEGRLQAGLQCGMAPPGFLSHFSSCSEFVLEQR